MSLQFCNTAGGMMVGLLVTLKAQPGKESMVSGMLKDALDLAREEDQTMSWYAFRVDDTTFGIFDTFADRNGLKAHLEGKIAADLMSQADELFTEPPQIQEFIILAAKT